METTVQEPLKITDEINRLRTLLSDQLKAATERINKAKDGLAYAQAELETAKTAGEAAELQYNSYNIAFPAPREQKQKVKPSASAGKNGGAQAKPAAIAGKVVMSRVKKSGAMTVPERVAAVMGDRDWNASELLEALAAANEEFESTNPRSYISTTLNSSLMNVQGPNGDIRDRSGKLVKAHVFTSVTRGRYRVATEQDIQDEVRKLLGASEVVISETTPADRVFADQGMDVRPALAATAAAHH